MDLVADILTTAFSRWTIQESQTTWEDVGQPWRKLSFVMVEGKDNTSHQPVCLLNGILGEHYFCVLWLFTFLNLPWSGKWNHSELFARREENSVPFLNSQCGFIIFVSGVPAFIVHSLVHLYLSFLTSSNHFDSSPIPLFVHASVFR